ncbi:hypothetical protein [Sorangium sp. So ce381]|uniref:hypothetical protein n=1 Tax=Sorangium sp. So ce381 TaxID=3133307 RepID=UPI003F5C3937
MTNDDHSIGSTPGSEQSASDDERAGAPTVTVYGAGIAGLTVAHELAERGFAVRVVECERAYDRRSDLAMAIGGVARTQYAAAKPNDRGSSEIVECRSELSPSDARLDPSRNHRVQLEVYFSEKATWIEQSEQDRVVRSLEWCLSNLQEARQAHIDVYRASLEEEEKRLANKREKAVKQLLGSVFRSHPVMARAPEPDIRVDYRDPERVSSIAAQRPEPPPVEIELFAHGKGIKNGPAVEAWLGEYFQGQAGRALRLVVTAGRDGPPPRDPYPYFRRASDASFVDNDDIARELRARGLAARHLRAVKESLWALLTSSVHVHSARTLRISGEIELVPGNAAASARLSNAERAALDGNASGRPARPPVRGRSVGARVSIRFGPLAERLASSQGMTGDSPEQTKFQKFANDLTRKLGSSLSLYEFNATFEPFMIPGSDEPAEGVSVLRVHASSWRPVMVEFDARSDSLETEEQLIKLKKGLADLCARKKREIYRVTITGYVDTRSDAGDAGDAGDERSAKPLQFAGIAGARAKVVEKIVREVLKENAYGAEFIVEPRSARPGELAASVLDSPAKHNRVAVVDVRRVMLPGEHGFRFFPSYYNHVFDTMRRIPILGVDGQETGRTVYDNVIPTPNQGVAQNGLSPLILPRSPPESAYERKERLSVLRDLGYTPLDILQFMLRTLRYMSTSSKRRAAELEAISWWEYLQGYDPRTGVCRYKYSERFTRDITTQARTLASFDAVWGDARTCGNTWVQLFYNWLQPAAKVDGTLNGPTSEAWLEPWKHYLTTRLEVEFVQGTLVRVELKEENGKQTVVPHVWLPNEVENKRGPGPDPKPSDYYIIATDPKTAEEVTRDLVAAPDSPGRIGVPLGLDGFTTHVRPQPPDEGPGTARGPSGKYGLAHWDRFQTMSGIQFFFKEEDFKLNDGYVFFNKAAWALTSINSAQFWAQRPAEKRDGFTSLMSVDLCDWSTKADGGPVIGKSMWECSANEIAEEVWRQITKEIRLATPPSHTGSPFAGVPPRPTWFHIDQNIEFGKDPPDFERPVRNRTPYLVPIKGDWRNRPGAQPWDPSPEAFNLPPDYPKEKRREGEWQARHGGYLVHWDKLVFAGVYLKTFTRMTTMEAANESGRHAANAILDHWLATRPGRWSPRHREAMRARADEDEEERIEEARHMRSSVFYTATPGGDYCKIWNPERWEMPDFMLAKQADERNFDLGLPHPWDICGLETIPSLLSHTINAKISSAAPNKLGASLPDSFEAAFETLLRSIYPEGGWDSMLDVLRRYRREIDEQMRNAARAARGEPLP